MTRPLSPLGMAALTLAVEYGAAVFPCEPRGKQPHATLAPDGFKGASSHPEQVAAWWDAAPSANIGLVPGSVQWLALDVDGPAGAATARAMGLDAVPTATVATSRGAHLYYTLPEGRVIGNVSGISCCDVRAHKGYVLAPPSVHPSGHVYCWRGASGDLWHRGLLEIAPAPRALLDALASAAAPPALQLAPRAGCATGQGTGAPGRRLARYLDTIGTVAQGQRNATAFRVAAFTMHDVGLPAGDAAAVVAAWNAERCAPPLPPGELRAVLRSAMRAGALPR